MPKISHKFKTISKLTLTLFALGMLGVFATPFAKLTQFQFLFDLLFIATRMMRDVFAFSAFHLCHRILNLSHNISLNTL